MSPAPSPLPARSDRVRAMDRARGFAVMGILLMNVVGFALPEAAYFNPRAGGGDGLTDHLLWALGFILVDGKMRGLFAMLFGASMVLLMERTEMEGGDGRLRFAIRNGWLLLFGLAHYLLLWWGDILTLYAIVGMIAMASAGASALTLAKRAFLLFGLQFLMLIVYVLLLHHGQSLAAAPEATPRQIAAFSATLASIGEPNSPQIGREMALYHGSWGGMVAQKAADAPGWLFASLRFMTLETLGFMLLGMAMLKSGFLTGAWAREQYVATARHGLLIALPPMVALAAWAWAGGFATVTTFDIVFVWAFPFRIPLTVAIAALVMIAAQKAAASPLLTRIEAVGRLSLSNYLGTSLLMTALFYGWGLDRFGQWSRAQLYALVPLVWLLMLLWSAPWVRHFRQGPLEWLWRSLILLRPQPFLRAAPSAPTP